MAMNNTRYQKLFLGLALAGPLVAAADPQTDVQQVITTATTVFLAAAVFGISVLGYRIVYRIIARLTK
jgi:hypothetical protein